MKPRSVPGAEAGAPSHFSSQQTRLWGMPGAAGPLLTEQSDGGWGIFGKYVS